MPTPIDRAVSQRVSDLSIPWNYFIIVGVFLRTNSRLLTLCRVPSSPLPLSLLVLQHGASGVKTSSLVLIPLVVSSTSLEYMQYSIDFHDRP
jgi:hypothetical protein